MDPGGPVQMAPTLTETFYDLDTNTHTPVYPQPTYPIVPSSTPAPTPILLPPRPPPLPVPVGMWSSSEGYAGGGEVSAAGQYLQSPITMESRYLPPATVQRSGYLPPPSSTRDSGYLLTSTTRESIYMQSSPTREVGYMTSTTGESGRSLHRQEDKLNDVGAAVSSSNCGIGVCGVSVNGSGAPGGVSGEAGGGSGVPGGGTGICGSAATCAVDESHGGAVAVEVPREERRHDGRTSGHRGRRPSCSDDEKEEAGEDDSGKDGDRTVDSSSQKHSQVAATLTWLTANYELAEGVCLPRYVVYNNYQDFCKKHGYTPAGPATFGKILRQKFPKLPTRRLGTRGQSKYHYYGIGIKESSEYYQVAYTGRGLTKYSGIKVKTEGSNRKFSLSSKAGTLLPEFPHVSNLILPAGVSPSTMETLLFMYRNHCQLIVDSVINANFEEVRHLVVNFWKRLPDHLTQVLSTDVLCDVVALCDSIVYKVLTDVLVPSSIQDMPESLEKQIKAFVRQLPEYLQKALEDVPECLQNIKIKACVRFSRSVTRHLDFVYVAQTTRAMMSKQENVTQMLCDMDTIDLEPIFTQMLCLMSVSARSFCNADKLIESLQELRSLLETHASVESYIEWIDSIADAYVLQPCKEKRKKIDNCARKFATTWSWVSLQFTRELTLLRCESYGQFQLLNMMLQEYVCLVSETQANQANDLEVQKVVQGHMKNAEDIQTLAKIRSGSNKLAASSPKNRKRKRDDQGDSTDELEGAPQSHDVRVDSRVSGQEETSAVNIASTSSPSYQSHTATAFTRPVPSAPRDSLYNPSEESDRLAYGYSSLPTSSGKSLCPVNAVAAYDRPPYFSQFGLNAYSDYVSHSAAMSSSRMPNHADHHGYGQTFPQVSLSAAGGGLSGSFHWGDSRTPAMLTDHYSQYGAHSVSSSFDSYKNAARLRDSVYSQEAALGGLNAARGYLPARPSDSYPGSSLAMGPAYGGNFMEIAPNGAQYPRHDALPAYQDDLYASGMATLHKHYFPSPFKC